MTQCPSVRIVTMTLCALTILAMAHPAIASPQNAPAAPQAAAAPTLDSLKKLAALNDEQRKALNNLVEERVRALSGGDAVAASEAIRSLRAATADSTPPFKEAFNASIIQLTRGQIARADAPSAVALCAVLGLTGSAEAANELVVALRDPKAPVRAAAAARLRDLRGAIAKVGGQFLAPTLRGLTDAAKIERDKSALEILYQALDYAETSNAGIADTVRAFLEVLEARRTAHAEDKVPAEGADLEVLTRMGKRLAGLDEAAKRQYGTQLGTLLRYYVDIYTTDAAEENALHKVQDSDNVELVARREAVEKIILESERQLIQLLGAGAGRDIAAAIKGADMTNAKIAYNAWAELLAQRYGENFDLHRK